MCELRSLSKVHVAISCSVSKYIVLRQGRSQNLLLLLDEFTLLDACQFSLGTTKYNLVHFTHSYFVNFFLSVLFSFSSCSTNIIRGNTLPRFKTHSSWDRIYLYEQAHGVDSLYISIKPIFPALCLNVSCVFI